MYSDDVLNDEQLSEIAQEYLEKMGYGNQPYMVYKHEDIDRHHIHIVSLRVDDIGKKINDKFEKKLIIKKEISKSRLPTLPKPLQYLIAFKVLGSIKHYYLYIISVWKKSKEIIKVVHITD